MLGLAGKNRARLDDALLELALARLRVLDVGLETTDDVRAVSSTSDPAVGIYKGWIEQLQKRGEGAVVSIVGSCRQKKKRVTPTGEQHGEATTLGVLPFGRPARICAVVGLVDDNHIIACPLKLRENPFLFEEVDGREAQRDVVKRVVSELALPAYLLQSGAIHDIKAKSEALQHLRLPLLEEETGRGDHEYPVSEAARH